MVRIGQARNFVFGASKIKLGGAGSAGTSMTELAVVGPLERRKEPKKQEQQNGSLVSTSAQLIPQSLLVPARNIVSLFPIVGCKDIAPP